MGIKSPVRTRTPTYYLDFHLEPNSKRFAQEIPEDWTTFAYTLKGKIKFLGEDKDKVIEAHHTVVFEEKNAKLEFQNAGDEEAHFVLIAGKPIKEPIVQHGPFVMNTREEIQQAFMDYQLSKNGFENAKNWASVEGNK